MSTPADADAHDMWLAERPDPDPPAVLDETEWATTPEAWRRANGVAEPEDPWAPTEETA